jgi:hypothetical protein
VGLAGNKKVSEKEVLTIAYIAYEYSLGNYQKPYDSLKKADKQCLISPNQDLSVYRWIAILPSLFQLIA